uniref:Uncharacterized protein n=1 Tax=Tetradesmus obliquus TaxID=3088 RepID=A0A383WLA3_TETOB|eukprot:jgi/Sobl393_1/5753/SZX66102.1
MQSLSGNLRGCTRFSKEQQRTATSAAANPSRCLLQQQQRCCSLPSHTSSSSNSRSNSRSSRLGLVCRAAPGGSNNPQQQTDYEREQLRQQGGYNYAPPRSSNQPPPQQQQQQQQQPWSWQQQQQQPWSAADPATKAGGAGRGGSSGGGGSNGDGDGGLSGYTKALIAAAFVTGLGAGVYFDAEINLSPNQVASTEIIDRRTPNAEVCMAYGYSAMVFDQRVFVTYNPFNLYVTQPEVKPGCILRRSNFNVLEREKLVDSKQVESCKKRMNTFGFVGDLAKDPEVSCVYHSEEAENQYLLNPEKSLQLGEGPSGANRGE